MLFRTAKARACSPWYRSTMLARISLGFLLSAAIAVFALARGSLTRGGALAACAIGTGIYVGLGAPGFVALCAFFFGSTLLGRVGRAHKEAIKRHYEKGDTRDAAQVFANGGVACLCALLSLAEPSFSWAFLGALGTAAGDTWATEIGVLSKRAPVSLATLKAVAAGTSGAVSSLGVLATGLGGLWVGLSYSVVSADSAFALRVMVISAVAALLGALMDSAIGAFVQAAYHCDACRVACEGSQHACGTATRKTAGWVAVNNDVVNLSATLFGALVAWLLALC